MTTPPINSQAGMNYDCVRCGRSCGEFIDISVDREMAEKINALPLEQLKDVPDPAGPVVDNPYYKGDLMMRLDKQGVCCLRNGQKLCSIHAAFGYDSKPRACRLFPFRFINTPGGVFAGVSFVCTAVQANSGPPINEQPAMLEELYRLTLNPREVKEPFYLSTDLPLSWGQYLQIEEDLADLLRPEFGPIYKRLIAQSIYIQLLAKFLREARMEAGAMTAGAEANEEALGVFRRRMKGKPEEAWPLVRKLAAKGRTSPVLRRLFLGFVHSVLNTFIVRRKQMPALLLLGEAYLRHATGHGVIQPYRHQAVKFRDLAGIGFQPARPEFDQLLTRYYQHCLYRKDLLLQDSIEFAQQMQLMHWGLIHWYGAALAVESGTTEIGEEQFNEALRIVEKSYVFHSKFSDIFRDYPMLRNIMDRMFARPLYAFSMARGEWMDKA